MYLDEEEAFTTSASSQLTLASAAAASHVSLLDPHSIIAGINFTTGYYATCHGFYAGK